MRMRAVRLDHIEEVQAFRVALVNNNIDFFFFFHLDQAKAKVHRLASSTRCTLLYPGQMSAMLMMMICSMSRRC